MATITEIAGAHRAQYGNVQVWGSWNQLGTISQVTSGNINNIWCGWNQYYGGTVTSVSCGNQTWQAWAGEQFSVGDGTVPETIIAATVTDYNVWPIWNNVYGNILHVHGERQNVYQETDEMRLTREVNARKASEERDAAVRRAEMLLLSLLSDKQVESYKKEKLFDVEVAGKVYRLRKDQRVALMGEKNVEKVLYCIHPSWEHHLPAEDVLISQKLLLEADEKEFLRIANATRLVA